MLDGNVLPLFGEPTETDLQFGIAKALLAIRQEMGVPYGQIARTIGVDVKTIKNAVCEEHLLSTLPLMRLAYHYPKPFELVEQFTKMNSVEPVTLPDMAAKLAEEIAALQRELDRQNTMRGAA